MAIINMQVECNVPQLHLRFNYIKFKFILKLFSISHHALLRKIQHSQTIAISINFSKYPFILLHVMDFTRAGMFDSILDRIQC